jgi:hypothetical protein
MLDPSSSEEDDSEREVTPPTRRLPATPCTGSSVGHPNAVGPASTPNRRRAQYAEDDTRSSESYVGQASVAFVGRGASASHGPSISVDQRSVSTASRASCDDSVDNLSLPGGAVGSGPAVAGQGQSIQGQGPNVYHHRPSGASLPPPPCSPGGLSSSSDRDASGTAAAGPVDPEREEEERRRKVQLYVFVIRCIAYPFNAKQPTDMIRRQTKVSKQQLQSLKDKFQVVF